MWEILNCRARRNESSVKRQRLCSLTVEWVRKGVNRLVSLFIDVEKVRLVPIASNVPVFTPMYVAHPIAPSRLFNNK